MFEKKHLIGIGVAVVIGLILGATFFGGGGSAAPITNDLRNNLYLDGVTIKATPESAIVWQIANLLQPSTASTTLQGTNRITGTLSVGSTGSTVSNVVTGKCTIHSTATTITASSTSETSCQAATNGTLSALTGVIDGDHCFLGAPTTTPTTFLGLEFYGSASSTSGYIHTIVKNLTGDTFTWTSTASSSIPYTCFRTS